MPVNLEQFVETFPRRDQLELLVNIHEDNRHPPIGLITQGFGAAAFAIGASELVVAYGHFADTHSGVAGFSAAMLGELHAAIESHAVAKRTWADLAYEEGDFWRDIFRTQLSRREGGVAAIGRGDILRAELVEFYRENPWVKKLVVAGSFTAMAALGLTTAAVQATRELDRPACIQMAAETAERDKEMMRKMARLEGRFTGNHLAAWQSIEDAHKAQVAACGSTWRAIDVEFDPENYRIRFHLGPGLQNPPRPGQP